MKELNGIDSKYRFVIFAAQRGKQLLKGAKPKIESESKNLIRIAQEEIARGVIKYEAISGKPVLEEKKKEVLEEGKEEKREKAER
ncbi:MAG: DNA-directed RNA polymerase subunit omega [Candidatus Aminicenantia bacterium]